MKGIAKKRMVTFRLTEEEFASLKAACLQERNSVSDVARKSILEWVDSASRAKVGERLEEIDEKLAQLIQMLAGRHNAE
jgi:hypothetical protein